MNHSGRILPPWLLTGCIGWIAGVGQAGRPFLPFLTGLLANREGIQSLQPLYVSLPVDSHTTFEEFVGAADGSLRRLVSMMGFLVCLWAIVPNHPRKAE